MEYDNKYSINNIPFDEEYQAKADIEIKDLEYDNENQCIVGDVTTRVKVFGEVIQEETLEDFAFKEHSNIIDTFTFNIEDNSTTETFIKNITVDISDVDTDANLIQVSIRPDTLGPTYPQYAGSENFVAHYLPANSGGSTRTGAYIASSGNVNIVSGSTGVYAKTPTYSSGILTIPLYRTYSSGYTQNWQGKYNGTISLLPIQRWKNDEV